MLHFLLFLKALQRLIPLVFLVINPYFSNLHLNHPMLCLPSRVLACVFFVYYEAMGLDKVSSQATNLHLP